MWCVLAFEGFWGGLARRPRAVQGWVVGPPPHQLQNEEFINMYTLKALEPKPILNLHRCQADLGHPWLIPTRCLPLCQGG